MDKVELLAPAGTYDSFTAALKAGADAVYLGLDRFGARAGAGNFTMDELLRALETAHLFNKKIYLTVNTLIKDSEMDDLYAMLREPYINGLDGVIVQDYGVVSYIRDNFKKLPIHASTQMSITEKAGVIFAKKAGIERVVPARELSLKEIKSIYDETGMELECFIHGAMCYSYSGKCLFSSYLGARSGNRGRCAQPCRLSYDNTYLLSMKDLCTIDFLGRLIDAGIASFKIEGRMKSPEYVAGVTGLYRKYIDGYYEKHLEKVSKEDEEALLSKYTRSGNCSGYYFNKNGRKMITLSSPSYQSSSDKSDLDKLPELNLPIDIKCRLRPNDNISFDFEYIYGNECRNFGFVSDVIAQKALKAPVDADAVIRQIVKTGGTAFKVTKCEALIDGEIFVPNSELNRARREALDALKREILKQHLRDFDEREHAKEAPSVSAKSYGGNDSDKPKINVSLLDIKALEEVIKYKWVKGIIVPLPLAAALFSDRYEKEAAIAAKDFEIYIKMPSVLRKTEKGMSTDAAFDLLYDISDRLFKRFGVREKGIYLDNYEALEGSADRHYEREKRADIHLYCFNRYSHRHLRDNGIGLTTVPLELDERELYRRGITGEELIVYGRAPMMISSQCVYNTQNSCRPSENGHFEYITDRKNQKLFVFGSCSDCTNTIYNSIPTSIMSEMSFIKKIKPESLRLDFTCETPSEIRGILLRMKEKLERDAQGVHDPADGKRELCDIYTKGHLHKGVE